MASDSERAQFKAQGYFIRPGFLDAARVAEVSAAVDRFAAVEPKFDGRNLHNYGALAELTVDPATLAVVGGLMGEAGFIFHHSHAAAHPPGLQGIAWHHDYEQIPQTNRSHLQLHVLHYLNGLDGTVGDLLLAPKTHRSVMRRGALSVYGTDDLPGTVVLDDLPPGSTVFAHSALVHARRPKPGGGRTRYFIDISYMQKGVLWPSYGREGWRDMLANLDAKVGHRAPGLFDVSGFFDIADGVARVGKAQGSLAMRLPEADESTRPMSGAIPVVQ
ncbi:MAG TPA: hypothetical protein VHZ78_13980 [Rhizomicrobium sp.]|jgi:hypothetical protein|nr:hypothetical protein [Rhizomicrobium sp.]